jgi:hypothetical protein
MTHVTDHKRYANRGRTNRGSIMPDSTPTPHQRAHENERPPKPQAPAAHDLDVEPGAADRIRGGFIPVPIPEPRTNL